MLSKGILLFTVVAVLQILVYGQQAPLITIPDGQLTGTVNRTYWQNVSYYAYRGIPFAQVPVGDLRFAAPVKNGPWQGVLNATSDRDQCTQLMGIAFGGPVVGSEDCLYVNVYTTNTNGSLPVMVWLYGGAFIGGSSEYSQYSPDHFLEKEVIFVSFNYRVGVFGFLSTEDSVASGNWGLKDQILALKWVKNNIAYFGGDPNSIAIFGESAGGTSIAYLVQSNQTTGLFSRAIMQSGSSLCPWGLTHNARHKAFSVGIRLGIITLSSRSLIDHLRQVDYQALKLAENNVTIQAYLTENLLAGLPFGVVEEPNYPGAFFTDKSWQQLSSGNFNRVPMIVGFNSNEGGALTEYVRRVIPVLIQYDLDVTRFPPYDLTQNWFKRLVSGTEIRRHYFGLFGPLSGEPEILVKFINVDQFERPIREFASQASKYSPVYYYRFGFEGLLGDPNNTHQGVGHAEELGYLFVVRNRSLTQMEYRIVDRIVTLWTNFAKTGDPNSPNSAPFGNITWLPNDPSVNTTTAIRFLNINNTLSMDTNPFQSDWDFYQGIYNTYGDPPYTTY